MLKEIGSSGLEFSEDIVVLVIFYFNKSIKASFINN